jgi:beta-lactamase class A
LKQKIEQVIQDYKKQNKLNGASVYLRDFRLGEWTLIGENERFAPGSLIKVPIMMTYLKAYEHDTKILDQKFVFNTPFEGIPIQNIKDRSIEMGKEYSVKELLKYMIAYSDNNATAILANNINFEVYKKVFTDLGLPEPKIQDSNFSISAKEYSIFIKALYNASYLTIDNSELGASLMGECTFKDGLSKGFPSDTKFAHKFGETGNALERQLHESGIIYLKNDSYMLTVMTKGKDLGQLSSILAAISKLVYDEMQGKSS